MTNSVKPPTPHQIQYALVGLAVGILYVVYAAGWAAICPLVGFTIGATVGSFKRD